jgi:hypothetical protein
MIFVDFLKGSAENTCSDSCARRLTDLLYRNIRYLIHPCVAASLPIGPRIEDIGTGTGHFLRCVQESGEFANATLDGYDISVSMYLEPLTENISRGGYGYETASYRGTLRNLWPSECPHARGSHPVLRVDSHCCQPRQGAETWWLAPVRRG